MIPLKLISETSWRRCAWVFVASCFGIVGLTLASVILIDPYDEGRFPSFMPPGTATDLPTTLNISRGRDPRFDAVALGDSRAVLIDPHQLSEGTPFRFVQMAVEGATIPDQALYLRWFARHHPAVRAITQMVGVGWCERGTDLGHSKDFPLALYSDSTLQYLRATVNTTSLRIAARRLSYAFGWAPRIDPSRFIDIGAKYHWRLDRTPREWHPLAGATEATAHDLPALRSLEQALAELPTQPPIVLWMPPLFIGALEPLGTEEGHVLESCKASLRAWAARRPHTAFLDLHVDSAYARDPDNFLDVNHPAHRLSPVIEARIVAAFAQMN